MNEQLKYPYLKFYFYASSSNPVLVISKETYDELCGYEPMQYKLENWEAFDKNQRASHDSYQRGLDKNGHINQLRKIAISSDEDFLKQRELIENDPNFIKWYE